MLKIRLRRMGARNAPFYRVVVSDGRRVPQSSALEEVGYYNPAKSPSVLSLDRERIDYWVSQGARMSDTVRSLMAREPASAPESEVKKAPEGKTEPEAEAES